ncbi:MAG: cysteine desulfurase [Clostridia bacterium]|nr:cysteine desulfurase [Clostridia bacterium]
MDKIYLDNSATTPICTAALDRMTAVYRDDWGNPSSVHGMGVSAGRILTDAKKTVISALGGVPGKGELIFTSGGTEADNLAVIGTALAKARNAGGKIIISDSEHPAVESAADHLATLGFEVVKIATRGGVLDLEGLERALGGKTVLVSLMSVNNETGAVYDLPIAFSLVKRLSPEALTHTDAVQGFLKSKESILSCGADAVTVSSHKIHGPKGIGALYLSADTVRGKKISPILHGGGQAGGMRSGTEDLPGIAAFAAAVEYGVNNLDAHLSQITQCREHLENRLMEDKTLAEVIVNRPGGKYSPHIISLALPRIRSEIMLRYLSGEGIFVSSGSACSSHSPGPSKTLLAFGLDRKRADSTIRVSLSHENTVEQIDRFCDVLAAGLKKIARV